MAHPKRRASKSRRNKRRTHKRKLEDIQLKKCTNCGALHRFHHVCTECGFYRGRQIINVT